jgi:hypothetical protein
MCLPDREKTSSPCCWRGWPLFVYRFVIGEEIYSGAGSARAAQDARNAKATRLEDPRAGLTESHDRYRPRSAHQDVNHRITTGHSNCYSASTGVRRGSRAEGPATSASGAATTRLPSGSAPWQRLMSAFQHRRHRGWLMCADQILTTRPRSPASPTKIPQVGVPGRPTGIPRTSRHSAAHPGTPGKVEPYQSTEQRKPRSGAGIPVLVMVVRGRVELPTFRFSGGRSYRLSYLTWLGP